MPHVVCSLESLQLEVVSQKSAAIRLIEVVSLFIQLNHLFTFRLLNIFIFKTCHDVLIKFFSYSLEPLLRFSSPCWVLHVFHSFCTYLV